MKAPISVCILAKNEEDVIADCIRSVNKFVKEVILLDTGSTDLTREIAASEGAVVRNGIWADDFGKSRNELIKYAAQPYVLMLDADERLVNPSLTDLEHAVSLLQNASNLVGRVEINNINDDNRISVAQIIRLFPNKIGFQYSGRIHEQLLYNEAPPETVVTKIRLTHYGYTKKTILSKDKIARNLKLLFAQLNDHANEPYTLFQIGKTYFVNKQYDEALTYLTEAYKYSNSNMPFYPSIIRTLAETFLRTKEWTQLLSLLDFAIQIFHDYTDLYYIYGSALIEIRTIESFQLIPTAFERCVELGDADPHKYEGEKGAGTYLAHYNLGLYYELSGNLEKAKFHYKTSGGLGFKLADSRLAQLS